MFLIGILALLLFINNTASRKTNKLSQVVVPLSSCKPQEQVCKVSTDRFEAEIEFDRNIFYLKPFNVAVRTKENENQYIKSIHIDFKIYLAKLILLYLSGFSLFLIIDF